jgi:hypothetical protein
MSAISARDLTTLDQETESYLDDETSIWSWLLTTDHKRIALLYLASITAFFFLGGAAAALMRLNLVAPDGFIASHELYNRLFTMHGVVMVWFFLVPAIPVTLGNFVTPLMLGARDLAFPRLNLANWYLFVGGGVICPGGAGAGRCRYRMDVLHAAFVALCARICGAGLHRHHPVRLLLDRHRVEFHGDDPQAAATGNGLVSAAAVPVVAVCDLGDLRIRLC